MNKVIIIKVAIDATVAITITTFLTSSWGFRLNDLSEPFLVVFVEDVGTLFDVVVEGKVFAAAIVAVVVIVVVMVVVLSDKLVVCVVGANRVIGSWIRNIFVKMSYKTFNIKCIYLTLHGCNTLYVILTNAS